MIDNFRADIIVKFKESGWSFAATLKAMGYHKPTVTDIKRLETVLDSQDLGLEDAGDFHARYENTEFVRDLCRVLGMPPAESDDHISRIKQQSKEEQAAFTPFMWIETEFKQPLEDPPVFMLPFFKSCRYLDFPPWFARLTPEQQLAQVQNLIVVHLLETGGELLWWGTIKRYWYFYAPERSYWLTPAGELIGKHEGAVPEFWHCEGITRHRRPRMGCEYTAEALSQALFYTDPLHTCCQENGCFDEYGLVAAEIVARRNAGQTLLEAIQSSIALYFFDNENVPVPDRITRPVIHWLENGGAPDE